MSQFRGAAEAVGMYVLIIAGLMVAVAVAHTTFVFWRNVYRRYKNAKEHGYGA